MMDGKSQGKDSIEELSKGSFEEVIEEEPVKVKEPVKPKHKNDRPYLAHIICIVLSFVIGIASFTIFKFEMAIIIWVILLIGHFFFTKFANYTYAEYEESKTRANLLVLVTFLSILFPLIFFYLFHRVSRNAIDVLFSSANLFTMFIFITLDVICTLVLIVIFLKRMQRIFFYKRFFYHVNILYRYHFCYICGITFGSILVCKEMIILAITPLVVNNLYLYLITLAFNALFFLFARFLPTFNRFLLGK